jgi:hypothetical protein
LAPYACSLVLATLWLVQIAWLTRLLLLLLLPCAEEDGDTAASKDTPASLPSAASMSGSKRPAVLADGTYASQVRSVAVPAGAEQVLGHTMMQGSQLCALPCCCLNSRRMLHFGLFPAIAAPPLSS